jgi:hypothetical protein
VALTHVYNRTPLKRLKWITPYEVIHGVKPDITHLRTLGCEAYVFRHEDTRANKLAPKSVACTYVGWGDSGHRFMTKTGKFIQSAHAIFDEMVFPRAKDARPTAKSHKVTEQSVAMLPNTFDSPNFNVGGGGYIPPIQSADSDAGPDEEPLVSLPAPEGTSPKPLHTCRTNVPRASLIPQISSGSNIHWNLGPSVSDPEASDADEPSVPTTPVAPRVPTPPPAVVQPRRGDRARNPVIRPGNAYGNAPPAEAQRVKTKEWRLMTGDTEAMRPLAPALGRAGAVPKPAEPPVLPTEPRSPVTERIRERVRAVTASAAAPSRPGMITLGSIVRTRSKGLPEIPQSETIDTSASNQTNDVTKMAREGEDGIIRYLMAMSASDSKPIREWTHRDVLALPYAY